MQWTAEGCFWRRVSILFFLFVYEISREPVNGFVPNSHGRRVRSIARTSLKVKVKCQGHQGQKRNFSALSAACVPFSSSIVPSSSNDMISWQSENIRTQFCVFCLLKAETHWQHWRPTMSLSVSDGRHDGPSRWPDSWQNISSKIWS